MRFPFVPAVIVPLSVSLFATRRTDVFFVAPGSVTTALSVSASSPVRFTVAGPMRSVAPLSFERSAISAVPEATRTSFVCSSPARTVVPPSLPFGLLTKSSRFGSVVTGPVTVSFAPVWTSRAIAPVRPPFAVVSFERT